MTTTNYSHNIVMCIIVSLRGNRSLGYAKSDLATLGMTRRGLELHMNDLY